MTFRNGSEGPEKDITDSPWFIGSVIAAIAAAVISMFIPFFLDYSRYEPLGVGQHANHFRPGGLKLPPEGEGEAYWHYMDYVSDYSYWARGEADDGSALIYAIAFQSSTDWPPVTYCVLTGPISQDEADNYINRLRDSLLESQAARVEVAGKPSANCAFGLTSKDIGYKFPED